MKIKELTTKNVFNIQVFDTKDSYLLNLKKYQLKRLINGTYPFEKQKQLSNYCLQFVLNNELIKSIREGIPRISYKFDSSIELIREDNKSKNLSKESMIKDEDSYLSFEKEPIIKKSGNFVLSFDKDELSTKTINLLLENINKANNMLTENKVKTYIKEQSLEDLNYEFYRKTINSIYYRKQAHAILMENNTPYLVLNIKEKQTPSENNDIVTEHKLKLKKLSFDEFQYFKEQMSEKYLSEYWETFKRNSIFMTMIYAHPELKITTKEELTQSWDSIVEYYNIYHSMKNSKEQKRNSSTIKI